MYRHVTRRRLLAGTAAVAVGVAGCAGDTDDQQHPERVDIDGTETCEVCGMVIAGSFGPNGQTAFDGPHPDEEATFAYYDSTRELYSDRLLQADRGTDPLVTYVTDYARTDYEIVPEDGRRYISGSVEAETLVDAGDVVYVVESGVHGAMGSELLPFSDPDAAEDFVESEGGRIIDAADVTRELIQALR